MSDRVFRQEPDGSWEPAEPIGWLEEHSKAQRLYFWVMGYQHCCNEEGQKLPRFWRKS